MTSDRLRTETVDEVLLAFLTLQDPEEVFAFLQDLCTVREIQELAQRLAVARMLAEGAHYTQVQRETGASATTISRVSKCLNYGAEGYRTVLGRLHPELAERFAAEGASAGHGSTSTASE